MLFRSLFGLVASLDGLVDREERFLEIGGGHGHFVQVDRLEQGLAEQPSDFVGDGCVELAEVSEQLNAVPEHVCPDVHALVCLVLLLFQSLAVTSNLLQSLLGSGLRDVAVCYQVDDPLFLHFQLLELPSDGGIHFADGRLALLEGDVQLGFGAVGKVVGQADGVHVAFYVLLDERYRKVRHVAESVLSPAAQVVGVGAALAGGFGVDEA